MQSFVDVLIVGAGPVGLNLALVLHNYGISFRIVDNKAEPSKTSNAVVVNSRSLETWEMMGFAEEAIARGLKLKGAQLFDGNKLLNTASFEKIESKFNFLLALPQSQTEALLIEQLSKHGIKVERNKQVVELEDRADDVLVSCQTDQGLEEITAKWLVGCDGYRSAVREFSGIERNCEDLSQHFIMIDATLKGDLDFEEITTVFNAAGSLIFIPMKDRVRVIAEIRNDPKYKDEKQGSEEVFRSILTQRHPGVTIDSVLWGSGFYVHECIAQNFKKGHVFLAGDAAHTHSPAGGQGMNTGIQDGWNLAWKLAHVLKGEASAELLDSYNKERRGIAHDVLKRSGLITKVSTTNNKLVQLLRNLGVGSMLSLDVVGAKIVNSLAQTDIYYADSPLIDSEQILYHGKTKLANPSMQWLLLSKDKIENKDGLPSCVMVEQDHLYWSDQPLCLVRPDGYIAMCADALFEISGYFTESGIK
ncbi:MAG: FAD-dependent monooxygenase [Burkholderiales bacterium]|nr:FAD-dependent monooxygenase [Burkholderiales bacterium]